MYNFSEILEVTLNLSMDNAKKIMAQSYRLLSNFLKKWNKFLCANIKNVMMKIYTYEGVIKYILNYIFLCWFDSYMKAFISSINQKKKDLKSTFNICVYENVICIAKSVKEYFSKCWQLLFLGGEIRAVFYFVIFATQYSLRFLK